MVEIEGCLDRQTFAISREKKVKVYEGINSKGIPVDQEDAGREGVRDAGRDRDRQEAVMTRIRGAKSKRDRIENVTPSE